MYGNTSPNRWQSKLGNFVRLRTSISSPCTPCIHDLYLSTSSFSVYSYMQLGSLLLALAIGCLSRLACTPMHETRQGRALIVDARTRWGGHDISNTQSSSLSADNVLAPSSIPSSSLSFIHDYLFSMTETRPWSSSIGLSCRLGE